MLTALTQFWLRCGPVVAATLGAVNLACGFAHADSSASYQYGYNDMMKTARGAVAIANGDGLHESLAQFVGSPQIAAKMCEGELQNIFESAALGARSQPPPDFSSADFLRGCNDAAKAMLASG
jgi:hypothetical protein